jgi:hypothetical protein
MSFLPHSKRAYSKLAQLYYEYLLVATRAGRHRLGPCGRQRVPPARSTILAVFYCRGRRVPSNYLITLYMVTPSPLGQTAFLTGFTTRVVTGTTTAPHASGILAKKAPLQVAPLQTPAPTLAKTK